MALELSILGGYPADEQIRVFSFELTRPADVNGYSAGDVISNSVATPALISIELGNDAIDAGIIAFLRLQTDSTNLASKTVNAHFFNDEIAATADNAAYEMRYANHEKRVGYMAVTFDAAQPGAGTNSVAGINNFDKVFFKPVSGFLHIQFQTVSAFVPFSGQKLFGQIGIIIRKATR
ncbi:MAG: hypothetical protein PHU33_16005 [Bacteroidales bacterium]|nr:hypothetical protein [Bacteroidales bacterium]